VSCVTQLKSASQTCDSIAAMREITELVNLPQRHTIGQHRLKGHLIG
jgi:hypothetical protein